MSFAFDVLNILMMNRHSQINLFLLQLPVSVYESVIDLINGEVSCVLELLAVGILQPHSCDLCTSVIKVSFEQCEKKSETCPARQIKKGQANVRFKNI